MKNQSHKLVSSKALKLGALLTVFGIVGLVGIINQAHASKMTAREILEARVIKVRAQINADLSRVSRTTQDDVVAQWGNWPNWPNWNNWRNWFNR
jgi:uncharacterized protein YajQ (UPF0234 family)